MTQQRITVYAVEAIGDDGEKQVIVQIMRGEEILCLLQGVDVRVVRDILIDVLDQFPYLVDGKRAVRASTDTFTVTAAAAKKASEN